MQELSMNILDIAQNSVKADAHLIEITVEIDDPNETLTISIDDDGSGMSKETLQRVTDPFYTSRTTRKVGLGIPFFKMAAEMTGGNLSIFSEKGIGTKVKAVFMKNHIDLMPLGDVASTVCVLMQCNPEIDFIYTIRRGSEEFCADSREIKAVLDGISISTPSVALFIREYIEDNQNPILKKEQNS